MENNQEKMNPFDFGTILGQIGMCQALYRDCRKLKMHTIFPLLEMKFVTHKLKKNNEEYSKVSM